MNAIWGILMVAVVIIIGLMLQRVFQGPTIYDRMNGLVLSVPIQFCYWYCSATLMDVLTCMWILQFLMRFWALSAL